jgi:hypothetical protein
LALAHDSKERMGKFTSWGSLVWGLLTMVAGAIVLLSDIRLVFVLSSVVVFSAFVIALLLPKGNFRPHSVPLFPGRMFVKNLHYYLPYLLRHTMACAIWAIWPLLLLRIGAGPLEIGLIQLVNGATQFLVMFFISDRIRPSRLFAFGLAASGVAFLTIFLAKDVYWMLPTQVLLGISWGTMYTGAVRFLMDNNKERATATGLLTSILSISNILGPLLAMLILFMGGGYYTIIFIAFIMAVVSAASFLALNWLRSEVKRTKAART